MQQSQNPNNGSSSQQRINNKKTTAFERIAAKANGGGGGGLNAFYWYQIFDVESAVVEAQTMLSSQGSFLTIAMYHYKETMQ